MELPECFLTARGNRNIHSALISIYRRKDSSVALVEFVQLWEARKKKKPRKRFRAVNIATMLRMVERLVFAKENAHLRLSECALISQLLESVARVLKHRLLGIYVSDLMHIIRVVSRLAHFGWEDINQLFREVLRHLNSPLFCVSHESRALFFKWVERCRGADSKIIQNAFDFLMKDGVEQVTAMKPEMLVDAACAATRSIPSSDRKRALLLHLAAKRFEREWRVFSPQEAVDLAWAVRIGDCKLRSAREFGRSLANALTAAPGQCARMVAAWGVAELSFIFGREINDDPALSVLFGRTMEKGFRCYDVLSGGFVVAISSAYLRAGLPLDSLALRVARWILNDEGAVKLRELPARSRRNIARVMMLSVFRVATTAPEVHRALRKLRGIEISFLYRLSREERDLPFYKLLYSTEAPWKKAR